MSSLSMKPVADEYAPYYAKYVELVPQANVVETLNRQMTDTLSLLAGISEEQAGHRYAPGKWSVKQLVGHVIDGERIFAYRALRFARNDKTALPGFEQDDYVTNGGFDRRRLSDIAREYEQVRRATIELFASLDEEAWSRSGKANDVEVTVRALAWIICGHELHHRGVLKAKYLA
ncbi:MAG TPA: DinB family protein [Blastocatellia bacterium]|nr:DinB family protein [Blastocatellia bacterium]